MTSRKITSVPLLLLLLALAAAIANAQAQFAITSSSFPPNGPIGATFTCSGANHSPALSWSGAPGTTGSFALILEDPDAPRGTFIHWVAYNLPSSMTGLRESAPKSATLADGGMQGVNGLGQIGYYGPCPPPGKVHHYHFRLFALDSTLSLAPGADASALESAMKGRVIASGELVGTYSR